MKKSLIAVAVAGLFAAPVAMAEVTLSGAINLGIEVAKSSSVPINVDTGAAAADSLTRTLLNANYSHVDLESVDDIGGGNKVIFHYQLNATPQNATGINDNNRNSFLGVAGTWGAFKMGTNENVYERMMYTADPLDGALGPGGNLMILGTPGMNAAFEAGQGSCATLGAATIIDLDPTSPTVGAEIANPNAGKGGCVDFYRRTDHTIWYESPNLSGFSFEIDYTLSAFKTKTTDPKVLSIGGKFQPEGAPFYVDLAYERHDDMFGAAAIAFTAGLGADFVAAGPTTSKDTGIQVGAGYMIGDLGLHARYERLKYEASGTDGRLAYKRNAYWFGVKYNLPSGYVGAELGVAADGTLDASSADGSLDGEKLNGTGAKMFGIGYFHNLSKQSQLQFIYGRTDNKANASYTQAGAPGTALGQDHQVLHVGIKHTF